MIRLGFLGLGRIGVARLKAMLATGVVEAAGVAEPSDEAAAAALALAPGAARVADLGALLALGLDGVVIATPSAGHAAQAEQALSAGVAVFCQKPLGRIATEVRDVVDAARRADRLLGVDLSYRHARGMVAIRELVAAGELGHVFAADLTFHNAYGPDKPWFYDLAAAGGGCVIDLGVHLVDLALTTLGWPEVTGVDAHLFAKGRPLRAGEVEDYAVATMTLAGGVAVRVACSWHLPAGQNAIIAAELYGTGGGAAFRNRADSYFEFDAERLIGTRREPLAHDAGEWWGDAAADWATRLAAGARFDAAAERFVTVAEVLDRVYGR